MVKILVANLFLGISLIAVSCDSKSVNSGGGGTRPLSLIIGDIEGTNLARNCTPTTLAKANSIDLGNGAGSSETFRFDSLMDTTGIVTSVAFVVDSGGEGATIIDCVTSGANDLENDFITENGPEMKKPWHLEGLAAGGRFTMTFTGGGHGTVRRSIRMYVDVNGNGTFDSTEVEDLIGLNGVIETRTFGQTITASTTGAIKGEWWGGSTNLAGENGAWRGWSVKSAP